MLAAISDFGDSGLLCPLVLLSAIFLMFGKGHNEAIALCVSFVIASIGITIAKLFFMNCGVDSVAGHINSPSGHSALSASVYSTYAWLFSQHRHGWKKKLPATLAFLLITGIATTRILLGFHTQGEVIIGLGIGFSSFLIIKITWLRNREIPVFHRRNLLLLMFITISLLHGIHFPAEDILHFLAHRLSPHAQLCISP